MNLENELKLTKDMVFENKVSDMQLADELEENLGDELNIEKNLESNIEKSNAKSVAVDNTIDGVIDTLEKNIEIEVDKLNLNESIWQKISKSDFSKVVKTAIESVLRGVLKKKFGINYSTFNDMKETLNSAMDGNLKKALKSSSDAAIDSIKKLDATTRSTIKTVKNAIIDKTIDSEKYEIINKQTKLLNRIGNNCEKFDEALQTNDEKAMKKNINAIKKDMDEILPIRETISKAQSALDKYSLWQNKGKESLSNEENELIEKLNKCA